MSIMSSWTWIKEPVSPVCGVKGPLIISMLISSSNSAQTPIAKRSCPGCTASATRSDSLSDMILHKSPQGAIERRPGYHLPADKHIRLDDIVGNIIVAMDTFLSHMLSELSVICEENATSAQSWAVNTGPSKGLWPS